MPHPKPRILALQPRIYYEELGIADQLDFFCDVKYGLVFSKSLPKFLSKFDAVVGCIYHSKSSQEIVSCANSIGVETVFFFDGIGDWSNFFKNLAMQQRGQYLLHPQIYSSIFCVDSATEKYFATKHVKVYKYMPRRVSQNLESGVSRRFSGVKKVLITTANQPYFDGTEKNELINILCRLRGELEYCGISLKIRIMDPDLYNKCFTSYVNDIDGSFESKLDDVDLVFTTPSSVVANCSRLYLPVCILDYRDGPMFVQGVAKYSSRTKLSNVLRSISENYENLIDFQNSQFSFEREVAIEKFFGDFSMKSRGVAFQRKFFFSLEYCFRFVLKKSGLMKKVKRMISKWC
jgi:hypothetical protein